MAARIIRASDRTVSDLRLPPNLIINQINAAFLFWGVQVFSEVAKQRLVDLVQYQGSVVPQPVLVPVNATLHHSLTEAIRAYKGTAGSDLRGRCVEYLSKANFYRYCREFKLECAVDGSAAQQTLIACGMSPSGPGEDWGSRGFQWLLYNLEDIRPDHRMYQERHRRLQNQFASGQSFYIMQAHLGNGVFALLPLDNLGK